MGGGATKSKKYEGASAGAPASEPKGSSGGAAQPKTIEKIDLRNPENFKSHLQDPSAAPARGRSCRAFDGEGDKSRESHVVRIALTGGPCAGKSSALEHITTAGKQHGFDVYTAPESATLIFSAGCSYPEDPESCYFFQQSLARLELQLERSLIKIAGNTGRPSIVIFDRGLMDIKGYIEDELWQRLLKDIGAGGDHHGANGIDENYLLSRYDAVIHLVTAADGAEEFYKWGKTSDDSGNIVIRGEPPEQARALDQKMRKAWENHKSHFIIKNGDAGFAAKMEEASRAVIDTAKRWHP